MTEHVPESTYPWNPLPFIWYMLTTVLVKLNLNKSRETQYLRDGE